MKTKTAHQDPGQDWVFGYGSLIYKVDFPWHARAVACIKGWSRRFWQGSHDHRGTPDAPGRVVTLVPDPGQVCLGVAYRVDRGVFAHLDHREKNGYERHRVSAILRDCGSRVAANLYVAGLDNPAFLGSGEPEQLASHIAGAHGPSGSNRAYLLDLARALREIGAEDEHVFELERLLGRTDSLD